MLLFKTIRYKNILSTGNIFTEIRLDEHKNTLIVGKNGVGKTTIIDALFFVLYNKPLRPINKPQLVNSITGKNLLVELEFSSANKNYLIRRGMKPNIFEIYCNDVMLNQDSQARDYQEMLEQQILKINFKSFSQVVVLSMANYTPFMKLPAYGRRQVIEDLLDIQIFSVMNTLLRERVSTNKDAIVENEYQVKLINNEIELHKKHILELNQNNQELIAARQKKIEEYNEQIKQYASQISETEAELQIEQNSFLRSGDVPQQIQTANNLLNKAKTVQKKLQSEIEFYQSSSICPTCDQHLDETFKGRKLEEKNQSFEKIGSGLPAIISKLEKLSVEMATRERLQTTISALNRKISNLNSDVSTANKFIDSLRKDIIELENKVQQVKNDNSQHKTLVAKLKNAETQKEGLLVDREVLSLASQLLKDGGIKTRIIKQYMPIMNKLINSYLAKMDFFVQFELDETFKETIKSRFRDEFSYESFSQGEKLRIDLSLLFSWRAIAKMRNSASTNLLFMDEILDSSLDNQGVDDFIKIVKGLTNDTNLFIISHRGDQLADKFDNIIKLEKKHNFSRIE